MSRSSLRGVGVARRGPFEGTFISGGALRSFPRCVGAGVGPISLLESLGGVIVRRSRGCEGPCEGTCLGCDGATFGACRGCDGEGAGVCLGSEGCDGVRLCGLCGLCGVTVLRSRGNESLGRALGADSGCLRSTGAVCGLLAGAS